jgi:hypothetical protein
MTNEITTIGTVQNKSGMWMMTVDGQMMGDSRPQATKAEAIAWITKFVRGWTNIRFEWN